MGYISHAGKPFSRGFRKAANRLGLSMREIAVIGDQIFTDVFGGNRAGALTCYVETLDRRFFWINVRYQLERGFIARGRRRMEARAHHAEPKFGPAGNSESFAAAGFKKSEDAPAWLAQMGLTAFEYQCGRGVRCGEETALKIGAAAKQHGIQMSVHAPYFINLSSEESERMEKNVGYVLETARLAVPLGATRMVVHCGGQGKLTRDRAMRNSHENVKNILRALDEAHLTGCAVCLETMGKKSVLGTAEEVCELVAADDRLLPCIDFGHLNCRTGGHMNTREEVKALFD